MTCLKYQYTGPIKKVFKKVEVQNLSVREINDMVAKVMNL